MLDARTHEFISGLVHELAKLPTETEWLEFKRNNDDPEELGRNVSALANSAALHGKASSFVVWGVDDATHAVVGTSFQPSLAKVGNENLENWLLRNLNPKVSLAFGSADIDGRRVVVLEVGAAFRYAVRFRDQGYVRVGSYTQPLKSQQEKERLLWKALDRTPWETGVAASRVSTDVALELLDTQSFFDLQGRSSPRNQEAILSVLEADRLVARSEAGGWDITNFGAILFARRLDDFTGLQRKAVRVIQYKGTARTETLKEQVGIKGYATGFTGLLEYLAALVPVNEIIGQALRRTVPMFPELAIREIVANALIHQEFAVSGAGPMVELFADRLEVSNPGTPLIEPVRFLDSAPQSRNEKLASLMRRLGVCEERGSGVDKVVAQVELFQLPAPVFEANAGSTRAILFSHRQLTKMEAADRIRATYQHACLRWVSREYVTNTTIRERFAIEPRNIATASRLLREAVEAGVIAPHDRDAPPRYMKYVPFWAA